MFGGGSSASGQQPTSSGVSDLLLGATGGFPSSLGAPSTTNGFGNDITGSQQQQPGGSGGATTFDLSADFPSLGGGTVSSDTAGSNGLAAALRQQQQLLAHQQMLQGTNQKSQQQQQQQQQQQHSSLYRLAMQGGGTNGSNFNMATEDFPALPGAPPTSRSNTVGAGGSGASGSVGNLGTSSSSATSPSPQSLLMGGSSNGAARIINVGGAGAPGGLRSTVGGGGQDSSGSALGSGSQLDGTGLLGGTGLGGLGGLDGLQLGRGGGTSQPTPQMYLQASRSATPSSTSGGGASVTAGSALSGDYGLLGLLGVIRMTDADRNALALGSDLSLLGLSLGSSDQIFNTFSGPWSESSGSTKEPHFQLPTCYYMQPPALKTGHLSKFQLETLFYIFYALPKDVLQAYSAQELYAREWRYHGDLKLWFRRAGPNDGVSASTTAPQYLYFDINSWERRLFNGNMNQNVTNGFLSEDDVRVKFPSS